MKAVLFFVLISQSIAAFSQDYPSRPVRLLVGFPPGGAMDSVARVIAPKLGASLGQQFVVDNRPGAAGAIAAGALVASPADGYALLLAESGALIVPAVNSKAGYDPVKQFA
ncbi:MAG TPA: tripartite tricarboxylate transporter substrate-binding protein, partial [Burkholderiales bacterium]